MDINIQHLRKRLIFYSILLIAFTLGFFVHSLIDGNKDKIAYIKMVDGCLLDMEQNIQLMILYSESEEEVNKFSKMLEADTEEFALILSHGGKLVSHRIPPQADGYGFDRISDVLNGELGPGFSKEPFFSSGLSEEETVFLKKLMLSIKSLREYTELESNNGHAALKMFLEAYRKFSLEWELVYGERCDADSPYYVFSV